uniref:Putative zinc finger protein ZK686.5 n=1 Tax=Caenorhabditis elegans TaxID=6239 RepID=YO15_CAEEL|nr:RecName: Full=Putative zinc finger protein ZK686.5 [Caenorhabditis elegans]
MPDFTIIQPDRKFDAAAVAGIFVRSSTSSSFPSASSYIAAKKRKNVDNTSTRKPYSYKDRKRKNTEEIRNIKKKLFMDLGIVRTNCGIDNEKQDREKAMKRKVTETIVTTYCELCEQNFSSSKMLLLHRGKVHNTPYIECHLCMKLFSQTIQFNRHMKTHYGPNAKIYVQCELCDRQFKDKQSLRTHWDVSHGSGDNQAVLA